MTARTPSPTLPPLTVILGSAGSGKTHWVLDKFEQTRGRGVIVLSSLPQAETFRELLSERTHFATADFKETVIHFRKFVHNLATTDPPSSFRPLQHALQRLALSNLCETHIQPDDFFGALRESSGFVNVLQSALREWKLAMLTPAMMEQAHHYLQERGEAPAFCRKFAEITALFRHYQEFLNRNRLHDPEDLLRVAIEHAETATVLTSVGNNVFIDGFFRLNEAQMQLLEALTRRKQTHNHALEVVLTLPYDAERPLLFAASERTLNNLRTRFTLQEITLETRQSARATALSYLETQLFRLKPAPHSPLQTQNTAPILLFDAPNNYVEAELAAREFLRLHNGGGYKWSDFAIILRTQGDYAPILSAVFERYGIPLGVDGAESLSENPFLQTVLRLLAIVCEGWKRDDLLAFLKSSYTKPDKLAADALRKRAQRRRVREGKARWLELVETMEDSPESIARALQDLATLEAEAEVEFGTPALYAEWLKKAVAHFGMLERMEEGEAVRVDKDREAWKVAQQTLEALGRIAELTGNESQSLKEFYAGVLAAWEETSALAYPKGERVRVAEPYEARESPIRVAAVMGLTERVFPRRIMEDPFFRDRERRLLHEVAGFALEEQSGRADDERLLYYLAVTAPSERLILSYPRATNNSDALPSFFLDETRALFTGEAQPLLEVVSRTLADIAPRPSEVVSEYDCLLAGCANLFDPGMESDIVGQKLRQEEARILLAGSLRSEGLGEATRRALLSRREPRFPMLRASDVLADFATPGVPYSVTALESHRRCPFQHLLRHILRVSPEEDGATPRVQGSILHATLRRYFRERLKTPEAETADSMNATLQRILEEEIRAESPDASRHRLEMARSLLSDAMAGFAERECAYTPAFKVTPSHFELAFGFGGAGGLMEADEEGGGVSTPEECDPESRPEPLYLRENATSAPVAVRGTIDRVDMLADDTRSLAVEYKLGGAPDNKAIQGGHSLQMPLYLLALERVFGKPPVGGCYDSMRETVRPRWVRAENTGQFRPVSELQEGPAIHLLNRDAYGSFLRQAEVLGARAGREIEEGVVAPIAGEHCKFCSYGDVCRTARDGVHDGEAGAFVEPQSPT